MQTFFVLPKSAIICDMKARILTAKEEKTWEKFVGSHPLASIHQTPLWGRFQSQVPSRGKYWIVVLEDNGKIVGGSMIIRHETHKNYTWLYSARGPLLNYDSPDLGNQMQKLLGQIEKIATKQNSIFYRIDPPLTTDNYINPPALKGFAKSHLGFQPEHTLILDISQPEEEILKQMKPKGRYNIRLATKKGVKVRAADPKKIKQFARDIDDFHRILKETTSRDQFYGHKKLFYHDMIETLSLENKAKMYLAEYEGKTIAGIIVTFFKDTAIYYYGVSSNEHRNVMAPYLLQWEAIKEAKSRGMKNYDFLGIAPENAKNHPWAGVTGFKKKFGGRSINYHPPQEFAFKKVVYWLYRLYKMIKG